MNMTPGEPYDRIRTALLFAIDGNNTDGAHHKQWYFDQIVKALCGGEEITKFGEMSSTPEYEEFLKDVEERGYGWDTGCIP